MRQDLLLFAHLCLFLTGALLYGFLTRELLRHPRVLPGRPMRLLVACLTVWYAGCLLDTLGALLIPGSDRLGHLATALDLLRGAAWLLSFPLLTHGLWQLLREEAWREDGGAVPSPTEAPPAWGWLVPGYLTLPFFLPTAAQAAWRESSFLLVAVGRSIYPLVFLHVALSSLCSAVLVVRIRRLVPFSDDARLAQFLRWLLAGLGIMVALIASGFLLGRVPAAAGWDEPLWRLAVESSGLVLGVTFLYFVLRYNLLRLSLSYRTLRHFAILIALIGVMTLAGSAMGAGGTPQFRRALHAAPERRPAPLGLAAPPPRQERLRRRAGRADPAAPIARPRRARPPRPRRRRDRPLARHPRPLPAAPGRRHPLDLVLRSRRPRLQPPRRPHRPPRLRSPALGPPGRLPPARRRRAGRHPGPRDQSGGRRLPGGGHGDRAARPPPARRRDGGPPPPRRTDRRRTPPCRARAPEPPRPGRRLPGARAEEPALFHEGPGQTVHEELAAAAPESDHARDLEVIVEQIDRLHGVAREILDYTRAPAESGAGVDLTALARRLLYVLGHEAKRRGIAIDAAGVEEVGGVGGIGGTSATWQTVLFNLLLNAAQHAPAGSTVRVRLAREDGGIAFVTENAGPPIPQEIAARLFEPFASTGQEGGTGLGLALVAERLRELGGTIRVTNEPDRIAFRVRVEERP